MKYFYPNCRNTEGNEQLNEPHWCIKCGRAIHPLACNRNAGHCIETCGGKAKAQP